MRKKQNGTIVGLDIGTTKICAIVGEINNGGVDIVGIGSHPSNGLRKGVVVNIESTVNSVRKVVEEAELMTGFAINSVYSGISGAHIKGFNSQGIIVIKNREVSESDVKRVIDASLDDFKRLVREAKHTKIPVYESQRNNVVGIVYSRSVLMGSQANLRELVQPIEFIPESTALDSALSSFRDRGMQIAGAFRNHF